MELSYDESFYEMKSPVSLKKTIGKEALLGSKAKAISKPKRMLSTQFIEETSDELINTMNELRAKTSQLVAVQAHTSIV